MQPFSHRVANEGWCLEMNGVLWAVRARTGAGCFPYILWDHIRADQAPITWIRWYFIAESSSTQNIFCLKNKASENTEGTEIPKAERTVKAIQFFYEPPPEEKKKGKCHVPMSFQSLRPWWRKWGSQGASFPRGCSGNPPVRARPLHGLPKASQIDRRSWWMQSTKCAHVWKGNFLFLWLETWNLSPFMFPVIFLLQTKRVIPPRGSQFQIHRVPATSEPIIFCCIKPISK